MKNSTRGRNNHRKQIEEYFDSNEFITIVNNIVNDIIQDIVTELQKKQDIQVDAVEGNLAVWNDAGQTIDDGFRVVNSVPDSESDLNKMVPSYQLMDDRVYKKDVTGTALNSLTIPNKLISNIAANDDWRVDIGTKTYMTVELFNSKMYNSNGKEYFYQFGLFIDLAEIEIGPIMLGRVYNATDESWSDWVVMSHIYIEAADAEEAKTISISNRQALVYVPEEEEI